MIELMVTLVILGLVFYCLSLLPIAEPFKTIIYVVGIIMAILLLLNFVGIGPRIGLY